MYRVSVENNGELREYIAENGENLLDLLRKQGYAIDSPCNGNGTCGKCRVKLLSENSAPAKAGEMKLLGVRAAEDGYRLACQHNINSDMKISVDSADATGRIVTDSIQRNNSINPIVTKIHKVLGQPGLDNQYSDIDRVFQALEGEGGRQFHMSNPQLLRSLPATIRHEAYEITIVAADSDIIAVEPGNTLDSLYGIAVDIGTTTIAAYLIDLTTGKKLSVTSLLNPQKAFGADVISRISHTMQHGNGLEELNNLLTEAINVCINTLCNQTGIKPSSVYAVTFAGNTTMLHLLMKVDPSNIALAPFIPVFTSDLKLRAADLNLNINPYGTAYLLPGVSAYVGADTIGAVLATRICEQASASLLIDIGTNGEIVLGGRDGLYACSAAAGPAFEGANISNGMGSVSGAISCVSLEQGIAYTTIGNTKPIGLCGTGVVDLLAALLEAGIVDETGRIDTAWKPVSPEQENLSERITSIDKSTAFILCKADETLSSSEIVLTQRDIREIQNAKAAIAAGIRVLLKESGIRFEDIGRVYLAGGFGSCINVSSALKIGLIPKELEGRIESVGNAAAQGAIDVLMDKAHLETARKLRKSIKYVELSGSKDFNDYYMDCMLFE
ncbi:MAG TPA: ASKHA domain-containing protein [Ruminiclostridium sp.]|nr:ASKHA domain-containing protein [Ruminiclostridium sp.]